MKVAVWDDDTKAAGEWKEQIDAVLDADDVVVNAPTRKDIEGELQMLHQRRRDYIETRHPAELVGQSELDETDILIVDNDLFELHAFSDFSAETVAARARVYTTCGYIVILNLNRDVDFDLSLLEHPHSKADLHINDRFIADEGLWLKCPKEHGTFRPWHWPLLPIAVEQYKIRVEEMRQVLNGNGKNTPVLDYFGFDEVVKTRLSRTARAFLHPNKNSETVSFLDFVQGNVSAVELKDGEEIIRRGDEAKMARICAHGLSKWLAGMVLGPQDNLIDLPHLVERLPFLIPDDQQDSVAFWNSCATLQDAGAEQLVEDISARRFQRHRWFDRPVFWWHKFDTEDNRGKLLVATDVNPEELVFCEDSSAFHASADCVSFVAAHHSTSDDRFVRWLKEELGEIKFGPQSRLAM